METNGIGDSRPRVNARLLTGGKPMVEPVKHTYRKVYLLTRLQRQLVASVDDLL